LTILVVIVITAESPKVPAPSRYVALAVISTSRLSTAKSGDWADRVAPVRASTHPPRRA
jgi:hypothetical protein